MDGSEIVSIEIDLHSGWGSRFPGSEPCLRPGSGLIVTRRRASCYREEDVRLDDPAGNVSAPRSYIPAPGDKSTVCASSLASLSGRPRTGLWSHIRRLQWHDLAECAFKVRSYDGSSLRACRQCSMTGKRARLLRPATRCLVPTLVRHLARARRCDHYKSALLMQMLHPSALANVCDRSTFRNDMLGRLRRTASSLRSPHIRNASLPKWPSKRARRSSQKLAARRGAHDQRTVEYR